MRLYMSSVSPSWVRADTTTIIVQKRKGDEVYILLKDMELIIGKCGRKKVVNLSATGELGYA